MFVPHLKVYNTDQKFCHLIYWQFIGIEKLISSMWRGSFYIENHTQIKWLYNLNKFDVVTKEQGDIPVFTEWYHSFLLPLKKIWLSCCSLEICYCRYARYMFANLKVSKSGVNFDKLRHIYTKRIQLSCPLHLFDTHIGMSYAYAFIYVVQLKQLLNH